MKFLCILFNFCHLMLDIISDLFARYLCFLQVPFYILYMSFMSEMFLKILGIQATNSYLKVKH